MLHHPDSQELCIYYYKRENITAGGQLVLEDYTPSRQELRVSYYRWVDITGGGLLVLKGDTTPVVRNSVFLATTGRYHWWWTASPQG